MTEGSFSRAQSWIVLLLAKKLDERKLRRPKETLTAAGCALA
jgi:hypothetical protein